MFSSFGNRMFSFLCLFHVHETAFPCGESPVSQQSLYLETRQADSLEDIALWAEPALKTAALY